MNKEAMFMRFRDATATKKRQGVRVHLHTTVSEKSKDLLAELTGDSGRLNDVLEEAIEYYSNKKDRPDCDDCESSQAFKMQNSMIQSADMVFVSSDLLTLLAEYGMGLYTPQELTRKVKRIGIEQMKILRGMSSVPEVLWENSFESLVAHVEFLKSIGIVRSIETTPERKTLMLTTGMLQDLPELLVTMLLAGWEEVGITTDIDIVAGSKISVKWVPDWEYRDIRAQRDHRIEELWRERREYYSLQAGHRGVVTLSPFLLDWLVENTIDDPIGDKILVSIKEFSRQIDSDKPSSQITLAEAVNNAVSTIGSSGLWEWSNAMQDGDIVRVQIRCRTSPMKDLSMKLLRSLLSMDAIEEIAREEGVVTAVLHFARTQEIGRKYPRE
jgi:hypothetical protein